MNTIRALNKVYDAVRKGSGLDVEPDYTTIGEIIFKAASEFSAFNTYKDRESGNVVYSLEVVLTADECATIDRDLDRFVRGYPNHRPYAAMTILGEALYRSFAADAGMKS